MAEAGFVVISAEDWERGRETLYVLENRSLMQQIARSLGDAGTDRCRRPPVRMEIDKDDIMM